jgi:pyrroloquinoline-quinone synthase
MLDHPFYQAWTEGTLPVEALREYARQYYHFEAAFPRFLSALHSRTESAAVRQLLLDNLWDEEHGERNHPALWLEFARAFGVSEHEVLHAAIRPETSALISHYREMTTTAPVDAALAALFAYEGQVPTVAGPKIEGLREHYSLEPMDYEFFAIHLEADVAHSGAEMEALESQCRDEDRVVAAAGDACDKLLGFLDGCLAAAV